MKIMKELNRLARKVERSGVDCVVISNQGEMVPPAKAYREHRLIPDFALVRKDGWTLGVPAEFSNSKNLGSDWEAVVTRDGIAIPYKLWVERSEKRRIVKWSRSKRSMSMV